MAQLFNFKNLEVSFFKKSKNMNIELIYENQDGYLTIDHIIELEQIFTWASNHLEIASISLQSSIDHLGKGFHPALLDRINETILRALLLRIQKLAYAIFFLPQTTIVNIGAGCEGVLSELVIPFDIKIAKKDCDIRFNHLFKGRTPACGGIGFLNQIVSHSFAKRWVLLGEKISHNELLVSGFIHNFTNQIENELLESISKQSPTARIQAKRSLLEIVLPELDRTMNDDQKFATASLVAGDWKNSPDYKNPRDLAKELKTSYDNVIDFASARNNN